MYHDLHILPKNDKYKLAFFTCSLALEEESERTERDRICFFRRKTGGAFGDVNLMFSATSAACLFSNSFTNTWL